MYSDVSQGKARRCFARQSKARSRFGEAMPGEARQGFFGGAV